MGRNSKRRRDAKKAVEAATRNKRTHEKQAERRRLVPEIFPFAITKNYRYAVQALNAGDDKQAVALLEREPNLSPCYGLALGDKALALIALGRFDEAEDALIAAANEFKKVGCPHPPSIPRFARAKAESLIFRGRYEEALTLLHDIVADIDEMKATNPGFEADFERERAALATSRGSALMHLARYEKALAAFQDARDIYDVHPDPIGRSKALTNFAHCARLAGQSYKAELAYNEAIDTVAPLQLREQTERIRASLADLIVPGSEKAFKLLRAEVQKMSTQQQHQQAFVQAGIWLQAAIEAENHEEARDALEASRSLEPRLSPTDHNRITLRTWAARFEAEAGNAEESVRLLIEGAYLWFKRVTEPVIEADLVAMATVMHDHFRMLSLSLLNAGRDSDALLAFETGRSLFHGLKVDPSYLEMLRGADPYARDGRGVRLDLLASVQATLLQDEVVVSFAALPPNLVAFIIGRGRVRSVRTPVADAPQLLQGLHLIPTRLREGVGVRCLPQSVVELARAVRDEVGARRVAAILPHGSLHNVPWRVLFREVGCQWSQLEAGIEFGLMLRARALEARRPISSCASVGYGRSRTIDFFDEARHVAEKFSTAGTFSANASSQTVYEAFRSSTFVHISCHGSVSMSDSQEVELELELEDGDFKLSAVRPSRLTNALVVLSACDSGVYEMRGGDFPLGAAPDLIRCGAQACIGSRFPLDAAFADWFFSSLARRLANGEPINASLASTSAEAEAAGADRWRLLGCVELLCSP